MPSTRSGSTPAPATSWRIDLDDGVVMANGSDAKLDGKPSAGEGRERNTARAI